MASSSNPGGANTVETDGFVVTSASVGDGVRQTTEQISSDLKGIGTGVPNDPRGTAFRTHSEEPPVDPKEVDPEDEPLEDDEPADGQPPAAPKEEKPADGQPPKKLSARERRKELRKEIDRLTWLRRENERKIAEQEARMKQLAAAPAAPAAPKTGEQPPAADPGKPAAAAADNSPAAIVRDEQELEGLGKMPRWAEYQADGKEWDEYQEDLVKWQDKRTELRTQVQKQREQFEEHERAALARHSQRMKALSEKDPNFAEEMKALESVPSRPFVEAIVLHHDKGDEFYYGLVKHPDVARAVATMELTRPVMDAVRASDVPFALIEHLASHPEDLVKINAMPPLFAQKALFTLNARLEASAPAPSSQPSTTNPNPPRPPLRTVAGSRNVGGEHKSHFDEEFGPDYISKGNEHESKYAQSRRR